MEMARNQCKKENPCCVFTGPYVHIQDALHFLAFMAVHICLKLFWKTVLAIYAQLVGDGSHGSSEALKAWEVRRSVAGFEDMIVLLVVTEALVQLYLVVGPLHLGHMRCGCISMLIYTYWNLPATATTVEILATAHMLSWAFNAGCALEVGHGLFLNYESRNPVADDVQMYGARD